MHWSRFAAMVSSSGDLQVPPLPRHLDKLSLVSRVSGVKGQARTSIQKYCSCLKFPVCVCVGGGVQPSFVLPVLFHMSTSSCVCTHLDTNTHRQEGDGSPSVGALLQPYFPIGHDTCGGWTGLTSCVLLRTVTMDPLVAPHFVKL